jgi:hypothetical protein
MKRDLLQTLDAERGEAVIVLQAAEFALNRGTAPVQILEPLSVAGDAREQPTAESKRQGWLVGLRASQWDDGFAATRLALAVDPYGVVALVHGARLELVAVSMERVEKGSDELGLVVSGRLHAPCKRQAGRG